MSNFEEKLALEMLKPAGGIVGALLAPKIKKIEEWTASKEIEAMLDDNSLPKIMDEYLNKLALRISEITSIAFSQLKLNIFEAYEPLTLTPQHTSGSSLHVNDIIDENFRSILVIDNAGMGKTTFSKFVVASLLYKSNRIPILFELRKVNKDFDLIENLAKEFDFPWKQFNRKLFCKLLQLGKFYVILDGFDEVSIDYQSKLSQQINQLSLDGGLNKILLTSRSQDLLPNIVKSIVLRFETFTREQAVSLLHRYDKISKLNVGGDLVKQIDSVPRKFIESPLLVSLLYKTFGVNKSIAEKACTFYGEIYDALYKGHDLLNKDGYVREKKSKLDFEDFRKLLRTMCYYMMLTRKTSFDSFPDASRCIEKSALACSKSPSSPLNFLDDLLVSVPLMYKEGVEYKFFHKTIQEYFSAEYIVSDKASSDTLGKLFNGSAAASFSKTFEFIYEINSSLFDSVITFHFANMAKDYDLDGGIVKKMLLSILFSKHAIIGVWDYNEHVEHLTLSGENDTEMLSSPTFFCRDIGELPNADGSFHYTTWAISEINGVKYFVAIKYCDRHSNLHHCAWDSISEDVSFNNIDFDVGIASDISSEDLLLLISAVGVNKWCSIDSSVVEKISNANSMQHLLFFVCDDGFAASEVDSVKLLSRKKINSVLERVKIEDAFSKEMEQLL